MTLAGSSVMPVSVPSLSKRAADQAIASKKLTRPKRGSAAEGPLSQFACAAALGFERRARGLRAGDGGRHSARDHNKPLHRH